MSYVLVRDIWHYIFEYLTIIEISRLKSVSRRFRDYVSKEIVYEYRTRFFKSYDYEPLFVGLFLMDQGYIDFLLTKRNLQMRVLALPTSNHIRELKSLLAKRAKKRREVDPVYRFLVRYLVKRSSIMIDDQ